MTEFADAPLTDMGAKMRPRWRLLLGVMTVWLARVQGAPAPPIITANTSTYEGNSRSAWTVYIQTDPETIRSIRCVEYTLHPAFPNPVREVCNRRGPQAFSLSATGWGTFQIGVRVFLRDGGVQPFTHQLRF
jgi:hypothetical protein